jgi:hypothetical protein
VQRRGEGIDEERKRKGREDDLQVVELGRRVDDERTGEVALLREVAVF